MEVNEQIMMQLWELAEDRCSPAQARALRELIARDEAVAAAWQEVECAQLSLSSWAPAQPSMRFQQNVLDRLPARSSAQELVPAWVRWAVAVSFVLAFLPVLIGLKRTSTDAYDGPLTSLQGLETKLSAWWPAWEWPTVNWTSTPTMLLYLALAGVGFSLLLALDRMLLQPRSRTYRSK